MEAPSGSAEASRLADPSKWHAAHTPTVLDDSAYGHEITTSMSAAPPSPTFDDFYRAHATDIGTALRLTLNDPELAEDALNEAMARALQRWRRVSTYTNPEGWVYRVAMNWALSWLRRRRRERERPVIAASAAPEPALFDQELHGALEQLSVDHRAVVVCRYLFDWSVARTAEALDIPHGTVKSRLARALDHVRDVLEGTHEH